MNSSHNIWKSIKSKLSLIFLLNRVQKLFKAVKYLSFRRLWAIAIKEGTVIFRDYAALGTLIFVPVFQLIIYGFAINKDPRHLDTIFVLQDGGPLARAAIAEITNTSYFKFHSISYDYDHARKLMQRGQVQFIITIPWNFTHQFVRQAKPTITVESDASDPALGTNASNALAKLESTFLRHEKEGSLNYIPERNNLVQFNILRHYNPEGITQYNIAPGLIGVILNLTLVMLTAVSLIREIETNTIEMLLSTPVRPLEVIIGKSLPFVIIGYLQLIFIYAISRIMFDVPMLGRFIDLVIISLPFVFANLCVGIFFSTIAKNQVQAMQFSGFFFLPSMMLGGFMFPTQAMPKWGQILGKCFPLNNYLKAIREIMLKGSSLIDLIPEISHICIFVFFISFLALINYRHTLE